MLYNFIVFIILQGIFVPIEKSWRKKKKKYENCKRKWHVMKTWGTFQSRLLFCCLKRVLIYWIYVWKDSWKANIINLINDEKSKFWHENKNFIFSCAFTKKGTQWKTTGDETICGFTVEIGIGCAGVFDLVINRYPLMCELLLGRMQTCSWEF